MGRDVSRPRVSGLVIPDSRVEWDEGESTVTQAGPRPGVPVPGNDTALALATTGSQSAGGSLAVRTQRGGFAAPDEAGFIWKNTSDASTLFRGWDPPQSLQGWDPAIWTDGSSFPEYVRNPHAIALANGDIIVACEIRDSGATPDEYRLEVVTRSATTGEWTRTATLVASETSFTEPPCPCLVLLPNGRILLYYIRVGSDYANLSMWYSDDSGGSWAFGGQGIADTSIYVNSTSGATIKRMRAAQRNGQILLIVDTEKYSVAANPRSGIAQYASDDQGNTFRQVEHWYHATYNIGGTDIVAHPDGFVVSTIGPRTSSASNAQIRLTGDAFRALSTITAITGGSAGLSDALDVALITTNAFSRADTALALDEDGTLYHYDLHDAGSYMAGLVSFSVDGGLTWDGVGLAQSFTTPGTSGGFWWNMGDDADYPHKFCAVAWRGRVLIIGPHAANPGDEDESLVAYHLGGYSTLTQAPIRRVAGAGTRAGWENMWVPIEGPANCGWTTTITGTGTIGTDGMYESSGAAAQVSLAWRAPGGAISDGMSAQFSVEVDTGGDYTSNRVAVICRVGDGAVSYGVIVRLQTTGFRVYDEGAGTQIDSTVLVDLTAGVEFRVEVVAAATNSARVWYRAAPLAMTSHAKTWTLAADTDALTDAGALNNRIEWGVLVAGAAAATSRWRYVAYTTDEFSGAKVNGLGFTNPTDLMPRSYSADPVYVSDGVRILASAGPTYVGDDWTIATRYDYEFRRCLEDTSPRRTFRQTGTTAMTIVLRLDGDLAEDTYLPGSCLAIYVGNSNVSEWVVSAYDEGVGYVTLGTATMTQGLSALQWVHGGGAIRPSTSTAIAAPFWLNEQEFRGGTFRVSNVLSLRIASQREGGWRTTGLRPVITLANYTAAAVAASGTTGAILPKDGLILVDLKGTKYSKIRLVAAAGSAQPVVPAEGYFEVGVLKVGMFVPFGQDYAWGRTVTTEHGTEVAEADDRTRSSRVRAPVRRTVEIGWTDAVDESQAAADGDPDYLLASWDGEAAGAPASTVRLLEGLVSETDGPHVPVVYVARAPIGGGLRVLNRRDAFVYGRLDADSIAREVVQGDEGIDEVVRLTSVQLTEEV